jgi:magnesium chelatase family protein
LPGPKSTYVGRLRGPVIDRIDLQCTVARIKRKELFQLPPGETSDVVAGRVRAARNRQRERYGKRGPQANADVPPRDIDKTCLLEPFARRAIELGLDKERLSARGAHRVIRVARTIADLAGREVVLEEHIDEALNFRVIDKSE